MEPTHAKDKPMATTSHRLDLVIRTSKRKKEARSPQQQRDMAYACAQTHHYKIAKVHDSGKSESGKTMDRASIRSAMERVRTGQTDGIIVALTDRIGRAPIEEAMATVRELDSIGGVFVPADAGGRPIDLSDPMAETNLVLQLQMARQYWMTAANRFKRSQRDAIKAGRFIGPTPLGYRRHKSGPDKGRLYPDPRWGMVVSTAYRLAATHGIHTAMDFLTGERVPDKHGKARVWTTTDARRLLASEVYLGVSRSGELHNDNAHKPLTTLETWTAAQSTPRGRRVNAEYPLTGVAVCNECGEPLHGQLQTVRKGGRSYRRYRCSNRACGGGSSISADTLEGYVREWAAAALTEWAIREWFDVADLEEARAALLDAKAERTAYVTKTAATDPDYEAGREARDRAIEERQTRFDALAEQAAHVEDLPAADQLDDSEALRAALRVLVDRITVRRGRGTAEDRVRIVRRHHDVDVAGASAA
jgi:DNA invertase Pin-like site-specific DNA recombinase